MDERTYRQIVDNAPDGIVVADAEGTIRFWNAGAVAIFGHPADEAVGQTLDLIVPEAQRTRHWEGYRRVMATGETRYARDLLAVPALHRDGRRLSIEFHVVLLRDESGAPFGVAAIIRDVTERWLRERAARQQRT
jgi:PAS domain S-box-containing protein